MFTNKVELLSESQGRSALRTDANASCCLFTTFWSVVGGLIVLQGSLWYAMRSYCTSSWYVVCNVVCGIQEVLLYFRVVCGIQEVRLERCIVTIASLDQWLATIENHHYQWLTDQKTIEKPLVPMVEQLPFHQWQWSP